MKLRHTLVLLALTAACDVPTELPKWDTTFVVQAENISLAVTQILPNSVTPANNNSAFQVSLSPSTFSRDLASLCAACVPLNGLTAPKPAFSQTFGTTIALPSQVESAQLTGGSVIVSMSHNFSFDPLRPSATARGSLAITVRSGSTIIGTATVVGTTTAFPPNTPLTVTIPLTAGLVQQALSVDVTVDSPQGDNTQMNTNARITATAAPTAVTVSSAQVAVVNKPVTTAPVTLDLTNIDEFVADHVQRGALLLTITNPFAVTGNLTLTMTGGTRTITKPVAVTPGTSTVEVPFDQSELQAILGHAITLTIAGQVSAGSPVQVLPTQSVSVISKLKLVIGAEAES